MLVIAIIDRHCHLMAKNDEYATSTRVVTGSSPVGGAKSQLSGLSCQPLKIDSWFIPEIQPMRLPPRTVEVIKPMMHRAW